MISLEQIKLIRQLKGLDPILIDSYQIPIVNELQQIIGYLKPVDKYFTENFQVINSLTNWRNKYMHFFLTQFQATNERTKSWLENIVLSQDTRIFFLILDETQKIIGNFGICNITKQSAELDNLIRGEKGGYPKLIYYSELTLINWIYNKLGIDNIYLHVLTHNSKTISLHESVGFIKIKKYKLIKEVIDEELRYVADYNNEPDNDEFGLFRMNLDKNYFISSYPWLEII